MFRKMTFSILLVTTIIFAEWVSFGQYNEPTDFSITVIDSSSSSVSFLVKLEGLLIEERYIYEIGQPYCDTLFHELKIPGSDFRTEKWGMPVIEKILVNIAGGTNQGWTIDSVKDTTITDVFLRPAGEYEFDTLTGFFLDSSAYYSNTYWPNDTIIEIEKTNYGINYNSLVINPIIYNDSLRECNVLEEVFISVDKVTPDSARVFNLNREGPLPNRVINPWDVSYIIPTTAEETVESLIVIVNSSDIQIVESYLNEIHKWGYYVKVYIIPDTLASYDTTNYEIENIVIPNSVKAWIDSGHTERAYVLILGNEEKIPLYWERDDRDLIRTNDSWFQRFDSDTTFYEFYIGRLPFSSVSEWNTIERKLLYHRYFKYDDWNPGNMLLIGGRETNKCHPFCDSVCYGFGWQSCATGPGWIFDNLKDSMLSIPGFTNEVRDIKACDCDDVDMWLSEQSRDSGIGVFVTYAHGYSTGISYRPEPCCTTGVCPMQRFNIERIKELPNGKLPISILWSCGTCDLLTETSNVFGEALLFEGEGGDSILGSTCVIGPNNYSYPSQSLTEGILNMAYRKEESTLGKLLYVNSYPISNYSFTSFSNNIRGLMFLTDPTLNIWTEIPNRFLVSLSIDELLPIDSAVDTTLTVIVTDTESTVINSAIVCVYKGELDTVTGEFNNEIFDLEFTNSSGVAEFTLNSELYDSINDLGYIYVTVKKYGFVTQPESINVGEEITIKFNPGWNLISLPYELHPNKSISELINISPYSIYSYYPDICGYIWYGDSLNEVDESYFVFDDTSSSVTFLGVKVSEWEDSVSLGWDLIGSIADTDSVELWGGNHCYLPDSLIPWYLKWGWDGVNYYQDDSVITGKGYWLLLPEDGTLSFPGDCGGSESGFTKLLIGQLRSLPNPPDTSSETGAPLPDTAHFSLDIDWANNKVLVTDKATNDTMANVLVAFQVGESVDFQYTETAGSNYFGIAETDLDIGINDSTWIVVFYPEYVEAIVHPYGTVSNGDTMWGDVYIYGDVVAESGDTLTILPGTNIYMKPTSAVWNYAYDVNNRTEIMAYGGHVQVYGTEEDPVHFRPGSGGSGLYQWGGLWAKVGGSFDVQWAQFDSCDGVGGYNGGNGPGRLKLTNTRHIGNQGVFGSWNGAGTIDGWFQMDTCYVEGRAMWYSNEDSCWARACSLSGSVTAGESYYTYNCETAPEFEDCILFDYNYRGGRAYGETNFSRSVFDGTGPAAYNYKKVGFQNCDIIANNGPYALYVTSSADASGSVTADSTRFRDFSNTGVYSYKDLDFGKYNCFIRDDATYTVDGNGVVMTTDSCYFDSLVVGVVKLTNNNRVNFCISDTTLSKVIGPDGKHILPENFSLGNAVPNPFNSTVAIEIDVPKDAEVVFEVFNILGDKIITLVDEELGRGRYKIVWDGLDSAGGELPSGTYLYRLRSDDFQETKKMTLVK